SLVSFFFFFFFSSRRRHTRFSRDWSSDVCSSDLDRLHLSGSISRSELTQITGLNRSTIADLIGELVGLGLVEEGPGAVTAGPGRPSPIARPRPEGSVTLALELSVDSIAAATVGLGGHVYNQVRVARPRAFFTPEETAEHLAQLAGPLI